MFSFIETVENEEKFVSTIPKKWIVDDILYWPPSGKNVAKLCAKEAEVQIAPYNDYKILQDDILTYDDARTREKYYSIYNNTDSEIEAIRVKADISDHPVHFKGGSTENDFNKLFDEQKNPSSTITEVSQLLNSTGNNMTNNLIENTSGDNPEQKLSFKVGKNKNKNVLKNTKHREIKSQESDKEFFKNKKRKFENEVGSNKGSLKYCHRVLNQQQKTPEIKNSTKKGMLISLKNEIRDQTIKIDETMEELEKLKTCVGVLTELIQSFCATLNKGRTIIKEDSLFQMPNLPLLNVIDLKKFNSLLLVSDYLQQVAVRLARMLSTTMSVNKMIKMMIEKIICYDVLLLHSWSGKSRISAKASRSKLAFNDYSGVITLIQVTIWIVKEISDENLKKLLVEILKRSTQNKIREDLKLNKTREVQPATSTSFDAFQDQDSTETDSSGDTDKTY